MGSFFFRFNGFFHVGSSEPHAKTIRSLSGEFLRTTKGTE